ncbi:RNAse III [Enhydrobacter aerosaccus]|uniref:Ribonuclease 3 n=1 Tax=Enhydrobacter aerosaccus TaxID=225324 RepID=A0A1T4JYZ1_9HYPH|nr:ribonuclease III [Enhydrobacter aerosaccus]SJZ35436.1 RNAse III [Enhydrobacter aerosaccus]
MARGNSFQPLLHGDPLKLGDIDFEALTKGLGHAFGNPELAAEALTHRSALDRRPELKLAFPNGNERLEFLGDRVLSLAMADLLLRRYPREREGELARRHASLVRAAALAEIAEAIDLGRHIRLSDPERGQKGGIKPNILADALEALLGAVFLDAGFAAAAASIETLWGDRVATHATAPRDAKTALQEWAQARRLPLPEYREVGREGPPHAPVFVVDVTIKGHEPGHGRGGNKREAERIAAAALLERLERI